MTAKTKSGADTSEGRPDDPPEEGAPSLAETASPRGDRAHLGSGQPRRVFESSIREAQQSGIFAEGHTAVQEEEDPPRISCSK
jgi:hypothetical protein